MFNLPSIVSIKKSSIKEHRHPTTDVRLSDKGSDRILFYPTARFHDCSTGFLSSCRWHEHVTCHRGKTYASSHTNGIRIKFGIGVYTQSLYLTQFSQDNGRVNEAEVGVYLAIKDITKLTPRYLAAHDSPNKSRLHSFKFGSRQCGGPFVFKTAVTPPVLHGEG
jgi:hypothetical protein